MGELAKINRQEIDNIALAAEEDAGFEKLLKFKKGVYSIEEEKVELGTQYTVHCVGWTKCWVKFADQKVVERRVYSVDRGERPPEREQLDDLDRNAWPLHNGQPSDPWVYQYLLPFEDQAGDIVVFVTSSFGGKRAVSDLCKSYSRRKARTGTTQLPVIKLESGTFRTQSYGDVLRPVFSIVGWDAAAEGIREIKAEALKEEEMNDDIPF